ncbi:uncharacterized protein ACA1_172710, partial [Acanthamoeba castellanii str. Neff]
MNLYPEELREPPVPVVAFIGGTKLHQSIFRNLSVVTLPDGTKRPQFFPLSMARSDSLPQSSAAAMASLAPSSSRKRVLSSLKKRGAGAAASMNGPSSLAGTSPTLESEMNMPPQGVLKANWMYKHTRVVPAVAVLLFPEWAKDHKWKAKEAEFHTMLDSIKGELRARNIRTLVVLVQKSPPPDSSHEERLSNFRKRAEVDSKRIIYFYESDISGSVGRLEKQMMEQALAFYKDVAQRLKKEKERLNKNVIGHKDYYVRYCFKVAFYTEFSKDTRISIKYGIMMRHSRVSVAHDLRHYLDGYINLANFAVERQRVMEIKTVAEYIHFKLCKLYFSTNSINDAVAQLERHIKTFRRVLGMAEKEFEHWAWLSRQYEVFAQLLEQHPQTIDAENKKCFPGYYYHVAAIYANKRKAIAKRLCEPVRGSPILDRYKDIDQKPLASIDRSKQVFVGQPPAPFQDHPLEAAGEPMVPDEMEDLYIAVAAELKVNHTDFVISLLQKARSYYTKTKASRMLLQIDALLAQQFVDAARYADAEPLFQALVQHYQEEGWWPLLNDVLESALVCEQDLANAPGYFTYALQLLPAEMTGSLKRKQQIQANIVAALASEVLVNEEMHLDVYVRSSFPSPIRFDALQLQFSDTSYNVSKESSDEDELLFQPGVERHFTFTLNARESPQQLQITEVLLELGHAPNSVVFCWDAQQPSQLKPHAQAEGSVEVLGSSSSKPDGASASASQVISIKELPAKIALNVVHEPPALVNEYYKLELNLQNTEDEPASGSMRLHIGNSANKEEPQFFAARNDRTPVGEIVFRDLAPGASTRHIVYVYFPTAGQKNTVITVSYETATRGSTVFATQLSIVIQRPFNVHFEFYTRDMKQILPSSTSQAAPFHQQQPSHPQASPTIQLPGQPPAFSASAAAASSGIGAPPSQSADLSSLLASQNLSASTFLSAPLSHPAGASAISPSMLLQPPAISLASSAELTSTILVEEMATDEDGVVVPPPAVPLTVDEPFWLMVEMTSTPPYPLSIEHTNLAMVNTTKENGPVATCTSTPFKPTVMESGQRYSLWYSITASVVGDSVNLATFSLRWKRKLRAGEPEPDEEEVASSV